MAMLAPAESSLPQPALIKSSLLRSAKSAGLDAKPAPDMPLKVPISAGAREGHLTESDEDQPTTGGTLTPDSCNHSTDGLATPPDAGDPVLTSGKASKATAGDAALVGLPPGLEDFSLGAGPGLTLEEQSRVAENMVVVQGLNKHYTAEEIVEELRHGGFRFRHDFQLFYLPWDLHEGLSFGYCFLGFISGSIRNQFVSAWQGKVLEWPGAAEGVTVARATVEDLEAAFMYSDMTLWKEQMGSPENALAMPEARVVPSAGRAPNFCSQCGTRVTAKHHNFCVSCGNPLKHL